MQQVVFLNLNIRYIFLRFKSGYCEVFLDFALEIALEQNSLRPLNKRIPDSIIIKSREKMEGNFANCITLNSNKTVKEIIINILDYLKNPVIIKNEISSIPSEHEKNFYHSLDLKFREKIGLLNQTILKNQDQQIIQKMNKTIANFKKFYQGLVKFFDSQKNLKNFDAMKEEQMLVFEKNFNVAKKIQFAEIELRTNEILGDMKEESVLNENKIEIYANLYSNYFFDILKRLLIL